MLDIDVHALSDEGDNGKVPSHSASYSFILAIVP